MITVSDKWAPALKASRSVTHLVEVWRGTDRIVDDLPVSGGTVVRDFGSDITLSASIEVADPAYLPAAIDDPLMPFGNEVRVLLGFEYPGGGKELLEVFRGPIVSTPTWPTSSYGFTIQAEGWMRYIADDRFTQPYAPSANIVVKTKRAIDELIAAAVPFESDSAFLFWEAGLPDPNVAADFLVEEDRLEAVKLLAGSVDAVMRERRLGGFRVAKDPVPNPAATPVRSYVYGESNTMLDRSEPELTREERYNGVLAFNPDDNTVRSLATITDSANPIHWGGMFGKRVLFYSSTLLTASTVAAAASTRLRNLQGRTRKITAEIAPDYSLEPGDHVLLRWPVNYRSKTQVEELAMIRRVEHSIGPGTTKLEMRGTG